jgi:hypothetical protein
MNDFEQDTITINGKEYNAPLRVEPEIGSIYWVIYRYHASMQVWDGYDVDKKRLQYGEVFASKEDCQAVADALNAILRGDL